MIHPDTEVRFINEEIGYGLFATKAIPRGTITWVFDQLDRELTPQELSTYSPSMRETILHYSYRNSKGNYIFCWDNARYTNHDCEPNSMLTAYNLELALRDIHPGEEITNHYGTLNIIEPFTISNPREVTIYPDDLLRHCSKWDTLLRQTFPYLPKVNQPLRSYLGETRWKDMEKIGQDAQLMVSLAHCYFSG